MANRRKYKDGELANLVELTEEEKAKRIVEKFLELIAPPEKLTVDKWSDKYRVLPRATSSEYGPWKTSRFPFLKRFMWCMSPQSKAKMPVVQKGAQLGYTEALINKIFYNADHYPGPTLYCQKTIEAGKDFATQKLDPSIAVCPKVADKLGVDKSSDLTDEKLNRGFPGGFVSIGGANSAAFLRSKSIRDALVDEEDSFKTSIESEGSPISLIRKRQANFPLSKMIRVSTPKIKETSTIEPARKAGSDERYYVPCPYCNPEADRYGFLFVMKWENIKWGEKKDLLTGVPIDVWLECPSCQARIDEHKKTWMLKHGRWLAQDKDTKELFEVGDVEYPSFKINSLYSPLGFFSWHDAVTEFFEYKATNDIALLQVFENQTLANTFSLAGQDVSSTWLQNRKTDYLNFRTGEIIDVPDGVLVLTAGVDVQADRIECEVIGWGLNHESWSIDYAVFWGNTDFLGDENGLDPNTKQPTVWTQLDRYLMKKWQHATGVQMPIECALIDSGYRSEQVHIFCRKRENRRIYPCKGKSTFGHTGYLKRPKKRTERFQTWHFIIWVDEIKDRIYQNFLVEMPGAGYCHFPEKDIYDSKYFQGLTSENKKVKIVGGQKKLYWETPPGARNEPLDCRVYGFAALIVYSPNLELRAQRNNPIGTNAINIGVEGSRIGKKKKKARVVSKGL